MRSLIRCSLRRTFPLISRFYLNFRSKKSDEVLPDSLVSVIIPIFDRTNLLRDAIESVLNQDYKNFELLLVCDGSPEATVEVVNQYLEHSSVRAFFLEGNSGTAVRARNFGIAQSVGKYIAFLDSDDICTKKRLSISTKILESEDVDIVYGSWIAIMDGSRAVGELKNGQLVNSIDANYENLYNISIPCQSTVVLRKELFEKFGLIKPQMKYREDHELWLRFAHFGARFRNITYPLTYLRLHEGNNEINFESESLDWLTKVREVHKNLGPSLNDYADKL